MKRLGCAVVTALAAALSVPSGGLAAALSVPSGGLAAASRSEAGPSGYAVYVTNELAGTLSIIDHERQAVTATFPLGKRPRGLRLGLDGRTLYIPLTGAAPAPPGMQRPPQSGAARADDGIALFDIVERRVVRTLSGVPDPERLAVGGDGKVYVASEETSALFVLDGESGRILARIPVGKEPEGVALSPDGRWVYVTSEGENKVTVVDTATSRPVGEIPVGARPRTVAFSADGSRAFVPGEMDRSVVVIDTARRAVINKVVLPGEDYLPMDVIVSPDDKWIYVSTGRGGEVVKLDAEQLIGFDSVDTGGRPWGIALSPDGQRLYAANGPAENVAIVDTADMTLRGSVRASGGPWGVVVAPRIGP